VRNPGYSSTPLSEIAIGLLNELKKINGRSKWLFPSDTSKSHMAGESIGKAVRRSHEAIFSEKGIKPFTPHDLRRTAWLSAKY
jgi:integrase